MKKYLIALIVMLLFMGICKESNAMDSYESYEYDDINTSYSYTYKNESSMEKEFEGYVILDTIPLNDFQRFDLYNGSRYIIEFIFTKTNKINQFYASDEMNFKMIMVAPGNSQMYDAFDNLYKCCPYNYVSIAYRDYFVVDGYEEYSNTINFNGYIGKFMEVFTFKKPSTMVIEYGGENRPSTDYNYFLGLVSMYRISEVLLVEGSDWIYEGENELVYEITDIVGNKARRRITVIGVYDVAPVLTVKSDIIPIDINNPKSLSDIKKEYFSAIDEIDGDVTGLIQLETKYNPSSLSVGIYPVLIEAYDLSNHVSMANVIIDVFDSAGLIENYEINVSYNKELEYDDIMRLAGFDFENNSYDINDEDYTDTSQIVGSYYFNVNITNKYGYEYPIEISINVVDDIAPVVNTTPIKTTTSTIITDDEIKNNISVSDYSKTSIEIDKSEYIPDAVGSYNIHVTVCDEYGNVSTGEVVINVDAQSTINYYNNTIRVYNDYALSKNEVIDFLRDISNNKYDTNTTSTVESDYFKTPLEVGTYQATLITTLPSGNEVREEYSIEVLAIAKSKKKKKRNIILRIIDAILSFFKMIGRFFIWLFRLFF